MKKVMRINCHSFFIGLFSGIILFGIVEAIGWFSPYLRSNFWDNPKLIFGYHIHHSVLGLVSIAWGLFSIAKKSKRAYFWIGFGLGIIAVHTIMGGFVFIEKIS